MTTLGSDKLPDRTRHLTPIESPANEAHNAIQGTAQELERPSSRLESCLEAALAGLRESDYAGVASELDGAQIVG